MSSPQSSNRISSEATEQTASRAIKVSGECFFTRDEMWAAGERTPVEVSTTSGKPRTMSYGSIHPPWVIVMSFGFALSASMICSSLSRCKLSAA